MLEVVPSIGRNWIAVVALFYSIETFTDLTSTVLVLVYKYVNIYINVSECISVSTHATPTRILLVETILQGDRTFRPVHATVYINSESVNRQLPAHKPQPTNTHRLE